MIPCAGGGGGSRQLKLCVRHRNHEHTQRQTNTKQTTNHTSGSAAAYARSTRRSAACPSSEAKRLVEGNVRARSFSMSPAASAPTGFFCFELVWVWLGFVCVWRFGSRRREPDQRARLPFDTHTYAAARTHTQLPTPLHSTATPLLTAASRSRYCCAASTPAPLRCSALSQSSTRILRGAESHTVLPT